MNVHQIPADMAVFVWTVMAISHANVQPDGLVSFLLFRILIRFWVLFKIIILMEALNALLLNGWFKL